MAALKVPPNPRPRFWIDPLPRYDWEYEKVGRFTWSGDYGPMCGGKIGLRHEYGWRALSERGIRRKLARLIRSERRKAFRRYATRTRGAA